MGILTLTTIKCHKYCRKTKQVGIRKGWGVSKTKPPNIYPEDLNIILQREIEERTY